MAEQGQKGAKNQESQRPAGSIGSGIQTMILAQEPPPKIDTTDRLNKKPRVTVAFPPCADDLLALIRTTVDDEVTKYFKEYFSFQPHQILGEYNAFDPATQQWSVKQLADDLAGPEGLDPALRHCLGWNGPVLRSAEPSRGRHGGWPSDCCVCPPCVTLDGNRNPSPRTDFSTPPRLKRLFLGDLVWLFYFERMGVFQILGAILDAFASNGRLPISNGSLIEASVRDDITALVLEVMVRQTKMGMSSTVRDRASAYRTCLGWTSDAGRKLNLDTATNSAFTNLFHKFIYNALEFYRDKRLAVAIRGTAATMAPPSVATLITISDTVDVLKKRFEPFAYGRNYYNTLSGILWTIAGLSVIRELTTTLGIAPAYGSPHEYIPAAYELLVMKRPPTQGEMNRYDLHRQCADNGRDILLDLEVIDHLDKAPGAELENWLTQAEGKIEGYRTAYRTLTGVDLGAAPTAMIEQQA